MKFYLFQVIIIDTLNIISYGGTTKTSGEAMKIKFWGTRGSIAVPGKDTLKYGGNTCCVEVISSSGKRLIIDAGTGIRNLGTHIVKTKEIEEIVLLITHIHWDHVIGFPFFAPAYSSDFKIKVDGFPTCMQGLKFIFQNKMLDGGFPIPFSELSAKITYMGQLEKGDASYCDMEIKRIELHHPQGGYGFRFFDGDRSLVFITDNELTDGHWKGRTFKHYVEFCEGADVLIHDSQYTPEEYKTRINWGHSHYLSTLRLAKESGVRSLILFHHDPQRNDQELDQIITELRLGHGIPDFFMDGAREGEAIEL